MRKAVAVAFSVALTVSAFGVVSAHGSTPNWVAHVQNYAGGISGGPRAKLAAAAAEAATANTDR